MWESTSEVDVSREGEIALETLPVAHPVVDLSHSFEKASKRTENHQAKSHLYFFSFLCLQPLCRFFTHPHSA